MELFVAGVLMLLGVIALLSGIKGTQAQLVGSLTAAPTAATTPAGNNAVHAVTNAPVMV